MEATKDNKSGPSFFNLLPRDAAQLVADEAMHEELCLDAEKRLLFVYDKHSPISGQSSEVWKAIIHKDYCSDALLDCNGKATIAIKKFRKEYSKLLDLEIASFDRIRRLHHNHVVRLLAANTGPERFLMFPWADGGTLQQFWQDTVPSSLDLKDMRGLIKESLIQFRGLADGIYRLHDEVKSRHGNLKPDHILRFKNKTQLGTLKMTDFSCSTERPDSLTRIRMAATMVPRRMHYENCEAPEDSFSRISDIWSMGCILLMHIIWLLYDYQALEEFRRRVHRFYEPTLGDEASVSGSVTDCVSRMAVDPRCASNTALGDLLRLVNYRLLVVKLPGGKGNIQHQRGEPDERATAKELLSTMNKIITASEKNEDYLFNGKAGYTYPLFRSRGCSVQTGNLLVPDMARHETAMSEQYLVRPALEMKDKNWRFTTDNDFALGVLGKVGEAAMFPTSLPGAAQLCHECGQLNWGRAGFSFKRHTSYLAEKSRSCGLCEMVWDVCQRKKLDTSKTVSFIRDASTLRTDGVPLPVLSIVSRTTTNSLQLGFPVLPEAGSETYFDVIRQWLKTCDKSLDCRREETFLPTRLIDVGRCEDKSMIWLVETKDGIAVQKYIALSHRWGDNTSYHFCTYPDDTGKLENSLSSHKRGIHVASLPATFRDAVYTTQALGVRYLWIDSLCILQGEGGDFIEEAKKMEEVFSSAYCVLAAACATNQTDGFLGIPPGRPLEDRRRKVVTILQGKEPLYLCEMIDDFDKHVLESELSGRGWVLQERALARRTIFFTGPQIYWECGHGVRCETMTKMNNDVAALLGDPCFPRLGFQGPGRGAGTLLYQELYAQYSRMKLGYIYDRPIAIRGLEERLIREFGGCGGHGIFDGVDGGDGGDGDLLARSLLWKRCVHRNGNGDEPNSLTRISFPKDSRGAPSWSWMAYDGAIEYLKIKWDTVCWAVGELRSPWDTTGKKESEWKEMGGVDEEYPTDGVLNMPDTESCLTAVAREFAADPDSELVMDSGVPCEHKLRCVVLGREKDEKKAGGKRLHCVLVVRQKEAEAEVPGRYERAGVGFLPGRCIDQRGLIIKIN